MTTIAPDDRASGSRHHWGAIPAALYALLGAAVTLAGWALGEPRLQAWDGSGITMKANAAVAAAACGGSLLLLVVAPAWRRLGHALALLAAALGGLTLFEHLSGVDLAIDTLLFAEAPGARATAAPGRMGPPASTSFLLLGGALVLARLRRGRGAAAVLALSALAIAALSIVGYLYGASQLYGFARLTGIAWQTATILAALAVGLLLAIPEHGPVATIRRTDSGGLVARRLVVPSLVLPLVIGGLTLLGAEAGLYDAPLAMALFALAMALALGALVWWTASGISRHAARTAEAQRALRASERLLSRALGAGRMYAWSWRLGDDVVTASSTVTDIAGLPRVGRAAELWRAVDPEDLPVMRAALARAVAERGEVQVEYRLRRPDDGRLVWLNARGRYERGEDGEERIDGITWDITARKRAEEALRQADRRKDEFLATLAHELRNPLAPIRNALQILRLSQQPQARSQAMEIAERQVGHMVRLIDDLMDVSRITSGRLQVQKQRVGLEAALASAVETARPLLEARGQRLELDLPEEPIHVDADVTRLAQVFANLLGNSAKYTAHGGHVTLTARLEDGVAVVAVRDDGIGIGPESLPRIFDMFWQSERGGAREGGLGIGLALVKGLVELHGGTIAAHSEGDGRGSEFVVRLPALSAEPAAAPARVAPREGRRGEGLRVLVVDDNRDNLTSLEALLQLLGSDVRIAGDGIEALEVAAEHRPHLVLMDLGMPRLDGLGATRRLRERPEGRTARIYAMTGWGQETDRRRTREAGCDGHLVKPVDPAVIQDLLGRLAEERLAEERQPGGEPGGMLSAPDAVP